MTLALGIACADGVVLGVDTELTIDYGKRPWPKIHVLPTPMDADYAIVAASAGHADSVRNATDSIFDQFSKLSEAQPSMRQIKKAIEDGLIEVYNRHIFPLPSQEERNEMDFTLLLAVSRRHSGQALSYELNAG